MGRNKGWHKRERNQRFCLNKENAKFLGVCSGIADYLNVQPWAIRLAFIISFFMGAWFVVPAYFVLWLVLDKKKASELKDNFDSNPAVVHLRNVDYKKGLYRNSRDGKFLGVCAGIADYLEVEVFWVRMVTIGVILFSGFIAMIAYFAAYFILNDKPKPAYLTHNPEYKKYKETLDETQHSKRPSFKACSRKYSSLQERLIRLEAHVTSSRFRLNTELRKLD